MIIFKVVGGLSLPNVGKIGFSRSPHFESLNGTLDVTSAYTIHSKNSIVMKWECFKPKRMGKL